MDNQEHTTGSFFVQREVLNELSLDEVAQKQTHSRNLPLGQQMKDFLRCSGPKLKQTVLGCVPVLSWLPSYSFRENAIGDLIAGLSIGIMHLPQGMAYALLASLPPVFGLYTSLYPVLVYVIFGTSRHISIGTFAVVSIMIGSVTERLAPDSDFSSVNGTNGTEGVDTVARDTYRVQIACAVTLLGGLFQVLLGLIRFGFVVTYLSEPLVRGYTTGAACHVTISQLKYLFGIYPHRFSGPLAQIYLLVDICSLLPETRVEELVVSMLALFVLIVVKEINAFYRDKMPLPVPIELIVIIAATTISYFVGLNGRYGIDVVGEIPTGLNAPRVPDVTILSEVVGDAFAIAIVAYALTISLGKTFALKHGYKVDSNQELIALGLSNIVGAFFQCYSVTSSLSRSLIQESTGGKTQVAGVVSSIIVLITVLQIGSLFQELPKAVLSTVVFVNLKGIFKQFQDVPVLWRSNKVDMLVWLVTFTCTILLNLDIGLAVSIAFSLLTIIFRTQLPRYSILGHVPGTELYLDKDTYEKAKEIPGITIFCSSASLYYTNTEMYLETLQEKSGISITKLLANKKKRDTMQKRQEEKEKREAKKERYTQRDLNSNPTPSSFSMIESEKSQYKGLAQSQNALAMTLTLCSTNGDVKGRENPTYQHEGSMSERDPDTCFSSDKTISQMSSNRDVVNEKGSGKHSIILDLSTTSFVDTVTVKTLKSIFRDFGEVDVDIYFACLQACVVEELESAGFFSESIPKNRLLPTVHDAVLHITKIHKPAYPTDHACVLDVSCITKM